MIQQADLKIAFKIWKAYNISSKATCYLHFALLVTDACSLNKFSLDSLVSPWNMLQSSDASYNLSYIEKETEALVKGEKGLGGTLLSS